MNAIIYTTNTGSTERYAKLPQNYRTLQKWKGSKVQNWALVRNQLATDDRIKARIEKYEHLI